MTTDHQTRIDELFEQTLELPENARRAFLERVCEGDVHLFAEVESLLDHDRRAPADFLMTPPMSGLRAANTDVEDDRLVGQQVGDFRVVRRIAVGGMGSVYEAEQQHPRRTVALKLMNSGLASRAAQRRFDHEAQILGRLRHPNIAHVYQSGIRREAKLGTRPVPYFAMEYIPDAMPITDHAAQRKLGNRQRLELFIQVCDAVQHGHQKGVIHRDLKPSNILVDATGTVKVIDFGVARCTDSDVAVTTMHTHTGELVGTLQYMSPEQCEGDPLELDVRSDVYSLGVLLFELLTGKLPYDLSHQTIHSSIRMVCEQPATRPSDFDRSLRGNLNAILLKALDKNRDQRYASVSDLAHDVKRHLSGEPIEARPPTLWTRCLRAAGRHPLVVTVATCLAIGAGVFGGTVLMTRRLALRPVDVRFGPENGSVDLLSALGGVLHTWESVPGGITNSLLVHQPASSSGGRTWALIGYSGLHPGELRGALAAYDLGSSMKTPAWKRTLATSDLPDILVQERGFGGNEFGIEYLAVWDVFPDEPGVEIVAAHQYARYAQTALRIYSSSGKLLYQVWIDGQVLSSYWMPDAEQLVIAGLNGIAYWPQRGHPEVKALSQHPLVVFAMKPRRGYISREYLTETPGDGPLQPVWYRCLWPPERLEQVITSIWLQRPTGSDPDRRVGINFEIAQDYNRGGMVLLVNEHGHELPDSRQLGDNYNLNRGVLPPPEVFQLHDLPPTLEPMRPGAAGTPVRRSTETSQRAAESRVRP